MEFLIIFFLILLNGIFSMSEIALVSSRKQRLEYAARRNVRGARTAFELANSPGRFLSTVQIGITLTGILTGIYSGESIAIQLQVWFEQFELIAPYAHSLAITFVLIVLTLVTLVLGELVPKRIGLTNPESISMKLAYPMKMLAYVTAPFVWLLTGTTDLIMAILPFKSSNNNVLTEEEIKSIIEESRSAGEVQDIEQKIVERVFTLGDRKVGALMTFRNEIKSLKVDDGPEEIRRVVNDELHSVYPVLNNKGNAVGIIHLKILFLHSGQKHFAIKDHLQPVHYFPQTMQAYQALEIFKTTGKHYAVVVDDYGGMQGFLTIHDLLTALVGSVDEFRTEYQLVQRPDGSYLMDGNYPLHDLLLHFDLDTTFESDINTVGGLITEELQRIPRVGDRITWKNLLLEVVDMDGARVDKLIVSKSTAS